MVTLRGKRENSKSAALQSHRVKPSKMTAERLGTKKVHSSIVWEEQTKTFAASAFSNIREREPWKNRGVS